MTSRTARSAQWRLGQASEKDTADIFRMWLEEGSWMRILLNVKRKATKSSEGLDRHVWTKEREPKYSFGKKAKLIAKKKA